MLVGCSKWKSSKSADESSPAIEVTETEDMTSQENLIDTEESLDAEKVSEDVSVDEKDLEGADINANNTEIDINDELEPTEASLSGEIKEYKVQKNETLMLIAFKLYGNPQKWRDLASKNPKVVSQAGIVKAGSVLKYAAPSQEFVWSPNGSPYLIKNGDTLGTISKEVYQTMSKWKLIWENNRQMIKDPNKIYAGFTLYYLDAREIAAEL